MSTQNTELIIPEFFGVVNFDQLNHVIEKLGQSRQNLSQEDKKFALDAIQTWEESVIKKLEYKSKEAENLLKCFEINTNYNMITSNGKEMSENETFLQIIEAIDAKAEFDEYMTAVRVAYTHKNSRPIQDTDDLNTTIEKSIENAAAYQAAYSKHDVIDASNTAKVRKAAAVLSQKFATDERVQELVTRLRRFKSNVDKFSIECTEKSQLAKLNVTINDDNVRDAIQELLDFTINI